MFSFFVLTMCETTCQGKNFSSSVANIGFFSLLLVILKYLCWCGNSAVYCALGLNIFSHVLFSSGLCDRFSLDKFGWEVS